MWMLSYISKVLKLYNHIYTNLRKSIINVIAKEYSGVKPDVTSVHLDGARTDCYGTRTERGRQFCSSGLFYVVDP